MIWRNLTRKSRANTQATDMQDIPSQAADGPTSSRTPVRSEQDERRLKALQRQRLAIQFDIEQGELAAEAENPWSSRIALLGEAIGTVNADIARTSRIEPGPWHEVPPSPVIIVEMITGDVSTVTLEIAGETFAFAEEPDWAERGHQITRPELTQRTGDLDRLVPADTPSDLRDQLREHLAGSMLVLASDLRDRALDDDRLPASITLDDLAPPCPACGGWANWRGTCQSCARRQAAIAALRREERRLTDEQAAEAEQRHRLIEGLPIARRRLKDIDSDIVRLTG